MLPVYAPPPQPGVIVQAPAAAPPNAPPTVPANIPPNLPPSAAAPPGALPNAGAPAAAPPAPVSPPPTEAPPPSLGTAAAGTVRVGVLLPLSGANAGLGQALLDAAQMALFDAGNNRLQLLPRDTQGTAAGAAEAARSAVGDGARLIIGPLLATEVEGAKPVAQAANVPVVAFSTATQLAGNGIYLMGFLPRQQIERVILFAHARGLARLAVLAPNTAYGDIAVAAARAAADANGTPLVRSDSYDAGAVDLSDAVRRFAAAGIDYDSLLLPEGGAKLKALAALLPYFDIDPEKVKYLGTGLWDDSSLGDEPVLSGAWYAAPAPGPRRDFEQRFKALYHHAPPRLATLAYDATALAAVLTRGANGGELSRAAIENPNGFTGIDGILRFHSDGLVQRGLAVLEIHRGGNIEVDPAPTTFEAQGY